MGENVCTVGIKNIMVILLCLYANYQLLYWVLFIKEKTRLGNFLFVTQF